MRKEGLSWEKNMIFFQIFFLLLISSNQSNCRRCSDFVCKWDFCVSLLGSSLRARASNNLCPVHKWTEKNTTLLFLLSRSMLMLKVEQWSFTVNFISLTLMVHARYLLDIFFIIVRETGGGGRCKVKAVADSNIIWVIKSKCVSCGTGKKFLIENFLYVCDRACKRRETHPHQLTFNNINKKMQKEKSISHPW